MTRITAIVLILFALGTNLPLHAQTDSPPPYLYYYSQMLGGLIVERADGTDSRQIAADVIPPNLMGISGPGWSPSGKYFAAYASYAGNPYLIEAKGKSVATKLMSTVKSTSYMQWSPTGEDILLMIGSFSAQPERTHDYFVWIIDAAHDKILSGFGMTIEDLFYGMSEADWDITGQQVSFYMHTELRKEVPIYRITMYFDGTTRRERSPNFGGSRALVDTYQEINAHNRSEGRASSPTGMYTSYGNHPPKLTNTRTGVIVELPVHTGSTFCREYIWTADEAYMITLDGTLIAGGGCASSVMGVTNPQGTLWRELGGCSWSYPACMGWLPANVDLNALPNGSPKPVQLDPINIEYARHIEYIAQYAGDLRLMCGQDSQGKSVGYLRQPEIDTILYTLRGMSCEKLLHVNPFKDGSVSIATAQDRVHHLLATYLGGDDVGVRLWIEKNGLYEPLFMLNSQGYELQFTDDGKYLRARNVNGWKIYSVADILAYASTQK